MQTLTKETLNEELAMSAMGPHWELFAPATRPADEEVELHATRNALRQAETVIRAQEDRIRALESLALTDELTGLANRRGFTLAFERELALTRRDSSDNGVLVMIDLDGFKSVNDQHGHQAGDVYLRAVAQVLTETVRASDTVARLGGDEFALVLPRMTEKQAAKRLAKLELAFHNRSINWNGKHVPLRASFGLAAYAGADTAETILHAADMRLYAHKARNRNLLSYAAG